MLALAGIILTFILTFVVGNKITQARQQDGWLAQQRFSGQEKEFFELKLLSDELAAVIGARVYLMRLLALKLIEESSDWEEVRIGYVDVLKKWNETLGSYYLRLSQLGLSDYRYKLERKLHIPMQVQGKELERVIRSRRQGIESQNGLAGVVAAINSIHSAELQFCEGLLATVARRKEEIYNPQDIHFSATTATSFSTWQLVKAVFVADVSRITIVRTPLNSRQPCRRR